MLSNNQQLILQYILDKLTELVEINNEIRNKLYVEIKTNPVKIIQSENEVLYPKKINKNKTK